MAKKKKANEEDFITENGLAAFKAMKLLHENFLTSDDDNKIKAWTNSNKTRLSEV